MNWNTKTQMIDINVKTTYKIFDENNNSLYISISVNNNDYQYFSNKLIIYENIFYNFT